MVKNIFEAKILLTEFERITQKSEKSEKYLEKIDLNIQINI